MTAFQYRYSITTQYCQYSQYYAHHAAPDRLIPQKFVDNFFKKGLDRAAELCYHKIVPRKLAVESEAERRDAFQSGGVRPDATQERGGRAFDIKEREGRYPWTSSTRKGSSALPHMTVDIDCSSWRIAAYVEKATGFQVIALQRARQMNRLTTEYD